MRESDVAIGAGRWVHVYDVGDVDAGVVMWQHGAGMRGVPPGPFVARAMAHGLRVVAFDRAGYGRSSARPDRTVADGALDALEVLDALNVSHAATIGLSAGGMHALACAALDPERIVAAATLCGPAPFDAPGLSWWQGMAEVNRGEFSAALKSRAELEKHLAESEIDFSAFSPADLAAMSGPYWEWQLSTVDSSSDEGSIEDVLASVHPWGIDVPKIRVPVLVIHGRQDSFVPVGHARWIADACSDSRLVIQDGGHISTIPAGELALPWLAGKLR